MGSDSGDSADSGVCCGGDHEGKWVGDSGGCGGHGGVRGVVGWWAYMHVGLCVGGDVITFGCLVCVV